MKKEKKYIIKLWRVLLIYFFEDMKFEGWTRIKYYARNFKNYILSMLLDKIRDKVANICIEYLHDNDAFILSIQYLFPLILREIK